MTDQLLVGGSEVDITPPVGLPMDGYLARTSVSREVHDPLLAQVLVMDDGQQRTAIVTLDVLAVSAPFADDLRRSLAVVLNTTSDAILICASHTHAGPSGLQNWFPIGSQPSLNFQLMKMIRTQLVQAAHEAVRRLAPANLTYGIGLIEGLGMDRNQPLPAPDPLVTALSFNLPDGSPSAIAVHYACHPTILGPQLAYSADFPGAVRRYIQAHFPGVICLYMNGAAGNISTRFTRNSQTFEEVERLGNLLAEGVIAALEHSHECLTHLGSSCVSLDLPFRTFLPASSHALEMTGNTRIDQTRAEGAVIEAQLAQAFGNRGIHHTRKAILCTLNIGPWRLLGVPGEPFNELASALKQISPFALVVGYTNDYLGYFPTQSAIEQETYEALSSPYDAHALDRIRDALLTLLPTVRTDIPKS